MKNVTRVSARYAETDMMGVVYHGNYLLYMEDARTAFLEAIGFPYERIEEAGYMSPVVSVSIEYGTPLRYGEQAFMVTWVTKSGSAKTVYAYELYREGDDPETAKPIIKATSTHCIVSRETFQAASIKRVFPELYAKYCEVVEPE